jgi:hypothetical protein
VSATPPAEEEAEAEPAAAEEPAPAPADGAEVERDEPSFNANGPGLIQHTPNAIMRERHSPVRL